MNCGKGVGGETQMTQAVQKLQCWLPGKCPPDCCNLLAGGKAPACGDQNDRWGYGEKERDAEQGRGHIERQLEQETLRA